VPDTVLEVADRKIMRTPPSPALKDPESGREDRDINTVVVQCDKCRGGEGCHRRR
jgi:hypothetical protein